MLTNTNHLRLAECEAKIYNGIKGFYEAGKSLLAIKEERLYKEAGHETFEDYCLIKWKFTRDYAKRLMNAYSVVHELEESFTENTPIGAVKEEEFCNPIDFKSLPVLPVTETQARPLSKIKDPEVRKQVWEEVVKKSEETHEPITAKAVEREVKKYCNPCDHDNMEFRVVTYLNKKYHDLFEKHRRGEKEAEFLRGIIEKTLTEMEKIKI